MEENGTLTPYGKLYTVANYVGTSVVSAFFASLERFSCINLTTTDLDDPDDDNYDSALMISSSTRHDDPRHSFPNPLPSAASTASVDSLPV